MLLPDPSQRLKGINRTSRHHVPMPGYRADQRRPRPGRAVSWLHRAGNSKGEPIVPAGSRVALRADDQQ